MKTVGEGGFFDGIARLLGANRRKFPFLGLSKNRQITDAEVAACRDLIAKIDQQTDSDARLAEGNWRTPANKRVYELKAGVAATKDYLSRLRIESGMFSGWHLSNLLASQPSWSWVDAIAERFPAENGDQSDWWIRAFRHYTRNLPRHYICAAPLVAGEIGHRVDGCCVNPDIVSYQERMAIMHRSGILEALRRKKQPVILEIGGGYGALAYFIKAALPHCTYCIVDLPSSLKFSGCYLRLSQRKYPVSIFEGGKIERDNRGFVLIPTSSLSTDVLSNVDLAINTLSFAEMPRATVANYAKYLKTALAPDGILLEQNFDNSHMQAPTHCDPNAALSDHLLQTGNVEGSWAWGNPKLWSAPKPSEFIASADSKQ